MQHCTCVFALKERKKAEKFRELLGLEPVTVVIKAEEFRELLGLEPVTVVIKAEEFRELLGLVPVTVVMKAVVTKMV